MNIRTKLERLALLADEDHGDCHASPMGEDGCNGCQIVAHDFAIDAEILRMREEAVGVK